jgi:hypothetical protein
VNTTVRTPQRCKSASVYGDGAVLVVSLGDQHPKVGLLDFQPVATILQTRDAIILEKKEDMKERGLASPDLADALTLTFAYPVAAHDHR